MSEPNNTFTVVGEGLEPRQFQQELCKRIQARLNAQGHAPKGRKRDRATIELLCGACYALEVLGSTQMNPLLMLTTIACSRNASEVVRQIAEKGTLE